MATAEEKKARSPEIRAATARQRIESPSTQLPRRRAPPPPRTAPDPDPKFLENLSEMFWFEDDKARGCPCAVILRVPVQALLPHHVMYLRMYIYIAKLFFSFSHDKEKLALFADLNYNSGSFRSL